MVRETLIETAREHGLQFPEICSYGQALRIVEESEEKYAILRETLSSLEATERINRQREKDEKFLERYSLGAAPLETFSQDISAEEAENLIKSWRAANRFVADFLIKMKGQPMEIADIKTSVPKEKPNEEPHKDSSYLDKLGESLVGQKVEGIRFSEDNKYVNWVYDMEKYIGQKGTIIEEHDHSVVVFFDDISFWYPKEEILKSFY